MTSRVPDSPGTSDSTGTSDVGVPLLIVSDDGHRLDTSRSLVLTRFSLFPKANGKVGVFSPELSVRRPKNCLF